jgi:hypothetical protein
MAPHSPASGRCRRLAKTLDQNRRGVRGKRVDPLRAGVVEGGVELGEGALELLAFRGAVLDCLLTFLLMAGDAVESPRRLRSVATVRSRSWVATAT